jgi:hypothetical protein
MISNEKTGNQTALVTGASSGIGLEFARIFAQHGYNLVLVTRNQTRLNEISKELVGNSRVAVTVIAKDLANPSAPNEIYEQLRSESMTIDVLVNCAGFGSLGLFFEEDLQSQLNMIQVNITAVTHLTHLFLKDMLNRGNGKILNVASTAAFQPGPLMAVYYATKAYVLSFSEAIANEVKGSGVTITTLCPGPTQTAFQANAKMQKTKLFNNSLLRTVPAETVAKIGYEGLMRSKTIVVPGITNTLGVFAVRLMPRDWITAVTRQLHEPV